MLMLLLCGCAPRESALEARLVQHSNDVLAEAGATPPTQTSSEELLQRAALLLQMPSGSTTGALEAVQDLFERLDPVWGGLLTTDTDQLDRRTDAALLQEQALALVVFEHAYQRSGEQRFRNAFDQVDAFVQDRLRSGQGNAAALGYAHALRAAPDRLPGHVSVARYWQLRRSHERRELGLPALAGEATAVDLAALGRAYLVRAQVSDGRRYRDEALRLATALAKPSWQLTPCEALAPTLVLWQMLESGLETSPAWQQRKAQLLAEHDLAGRASEHCDNPGVLSAVAHWLALQRQPEAARATLDMLLDRPPGAAQVPWLAALAQAWAVYAVLEARRDGAPAGEERTNSER
ncbi:MAG: hypothetical protein AAGI15_07410 [Pseudomonadota bacterium]